MEICYIIEVSVICQIEVVRGCREFGGQSIYLFHARYYAMRFPERTHEILCIFVVKCVLIESAAYLEV